MKIPQNNIPRPVQVKIAAILLILCTGFGIIYLASRAHLDKPFTYIVLAVLASIPLLITWQIFVGKNWARWLFLVLVILTLFRIPAIIEQLQAHSSFQNWFYCFQTLMQVVCMVLLYLPPSNEWFKKRASAA